MSFYWPDSYLKDLSPIKIKIVLKALLDRNLNGTILFPVCRRITILNKLLALGTLLTSGVWSSLERGFMKINICFDVDTQEKEWYHWLSVYKSLLSDNVNSIGLYPIS